MPDKPAPQVVTIPNVKLVRTGTWAASTGVTTITRDDLEDMVLASSDPDIDEAAVKLGHTDPINASILADGVPALGWVENLRVEDEEDGARSILVGDLTNVPEPLAQVLPLAYKRRSAEIAWIVKTAGGNRYRAALTALSLLGKFAPAVKGLGEPIEDLEDLYALYGLSKPEERVLETTLTAERVSALMGEQFDRESAKISGKPTPGLEVGSTSELADAINVDAIRDAWRDAHPYDPEEPSTDSWVREVWLEPGTMGGYLIVEGGDTEPDELLRIAWTAEDDGSIKLGTQEKVRVTYEPAKLAARRAILAQASARTIDHETTKTLLAAIPIPTSAKNPPLSGEPGDNDGNETPTGGRSMDTKRIEELLANEDEAAAVEAFKKLRSENPPTAPEGDKPDGGNGDGAETPPATEPGTSTDTPPQAEPAKAETADDPLLVKLSAGSWDEVRSDLKAGRDAMQREHDRDVKAALRTALREGRISTEENEVKAWTDRLDKDLEGTKSLLKTLQPRFSTVEIGDDDALTAETDDAAFDAFEKSVFGADFGAPVQGGN